MSHFHDLSYLLKTDHAGHFSGRVVELPAVMTQGTSEKEVQEKIGKAALEYLQTFEDEHKQLIDGKSVPRLVDSGTGIIIKTETFRVYC